MIDLCVLYVVYVLIVSISPPQHWVHRTTGFIRTVLAKLMQNSALEDVIALDTSRHQATPFTLQSLHVHGK